MAVKPRQQRVDEKVELACLYIYNLERQGVVIDGRSKNGIGFAQIVADLEEHYGNKVHHYENPDSLRKIYRNWKKRHNL